MAQHTQSLASDPSRAAPANTFALTPLLRELAPRALPGRGLAWAAPAFVWGVWALMILGGLAFVHTYASFVPFMDDWEWVPAVAGAEPFSLSWVWAQLNDHRHPLAKVLLYGLYKLSGGDFRIGMYANVVCMAALSCATILVARGVRGRTSFLDAFFPLALLNIDKEIIFLGMGVSTIPAMALAGFMLLIVVRQGNRPTAATALLAGGCVLLLALIGTIGLALVPALVLWLAYWGALSYRSGRPGGVRNALLVWGFAALALAMVPLYFVNFKPYDQAPPSPGWWATLRTTLQYLSMGMGQAGRLSFLALPDWLPPPVGVGVTLLALASAAFLVRVWLTRPAERPRAAGLFCFLLAAASLAFGVGAARAGGGAHAGFAPRYVLLAMPVVTCIYFIWTVYGVGAGRLIPPALFALLCVLFPFCVQGTLREGREHGRNMAAVERDIRARKRPSLIATEHAHFLYDQVSGEQLAEYLRMLSRARIGPFRRLPDDAHTFHSVLVTGAPAELRGATWRDGTVTAEGADSFLVFALSKTRSVHAIRIRYAYEKAAAPAAFQVFWRRSVQNDFAEGRRHARFDLETGRGEQTLTVVVDADIDQFRIHPGDKPCTLRITAITLLTMVEEPPGAYSRAVAGLREVANTTLPRDAVVAVVAKEDKRLLDLGERRQASYFLREGEYYPEDADGAVALLKAAEARGARFLLLPGWSCWWLEDYKGFNAYLREHCRVMHRGDDCTIFDLRPDVD